MREISSILLAAFILLSSQTTSANDSETVSLYRKALEGMNRPLQKDDFGSVGLKTAQDFDALVQMCIEAGDYAQAKELTEKALELDAFDPIANLNAGLLYYKQEEYQKAVYYLSWALKIEKNLYKTKRVRLGEELLSTSEPPAYLPIMVLLDKAMEKAGTKPEADETEGEERAESREEETAPSSITVPSYEILRDVDKPGKVRKLDILVSPDTTKKDALDLARNFMGKYEDYAIVNIKIFDDKEVYENRGSSTEPEEAFSDHFLVDAVKNKYIGADWVKWIAEGRKENSDYTKSNIIEPARVSEKGANTLENTSLYLGMPATDVILKLGYPHAEERVDSGIGGKSENWIYPSGKRWLYVNIAKEGLFLKDTVIGWGPREVK